MGTFIALLRGINVSGQKIIQMELLRNVLAELDLQNISTYIQSGNVIFDSVINDTKDLEGRIAQKIEAHFGFVVSVRVTTSEEMTTIIEENPFANQSLSDPTQPYVAFLSEKPSKEDLVQLQAMDFSGDQFINKRKVLYLRYTTSAGHTRLTNALIEKKLKVQATSRNWKTVLKLMELAQK